MMRWLVNVWRIVLMAITTRADLVLNAYRMREENEKLQSRILALMVDLDVALEELERVETQLAYTRERLKIHETHDAPTLRRITIPDATPPTHTR